MESSKGLLKLMAQRWKSCSLSLCCKGKGSDRSCWSTQSRIILSPFYGRWRKMRRPFRSMKDMAFTSRTIGKMKRGPTNISFDWCDYSAELWMESSPPACLPKQQGFGKQAGGLIIWIGDDLWSHLREHCHVHALPVSWIWRRCHLAVGHLWSEWQL